MTEFRVERLDHVHVTVKDRGRAVAWYCDVFGLSKQYDYTEHGDARGPVVLAAEDGETHLALFESKAATPNSQVVAFRTDAKGLKAFLARLNDLDLRDPKGQRVTAADVADHGTSWSIYFCDSDGNPYEITTYDYAEFASRT
jgi:catechol 2,3-dioxygenase-like lactoylglutathione lyase family enzyme